METGPAALTEKEKEALRLLLEGHDAKSSAVELDLSVHTINDRLRNARRKLNVSSSREAARILGDTEGRAPQNPAPASFGMGEDGASPDIADLSNTKRVGAPRVTWLAGGMLLMSILIAAAIITVGMPGEEAAPATAKAAEPMAQSTLVNPEDAASLPPARAFLAEIDAGDWTGSWEIAGEAFRSATSAQEWAAAVEPVRAPLGEATERRLATVTRASTLPGAPEGEYQVIQFQTVFSKRSGVMTETVVMAMGSDGWEVAGYFIA